MLAWGCAIAWAEDATFSTPFVEAGTSPINRFQGELGAVLVSGNASSYALSAAANASRSWPDHRVSLVAAGALGGAVMDLNGNGVIDDQDRGKAPDSPPEAGFTETAQRVSCDVRYDRRVNERVGMYLLVGAYRDPFVGFDLRSHTQVGVSRSLLQEPDTQVRVELGGDFAREDYTPIDVFDPETWAVVGQEELPSSQILSTRFFAWANHALSPQVGVSSSVEVIGNVRDLQDARILNTSAITSALGKQLALRVSHSIVYDNEPVPSFGPLDQTSMASLVVTLFQDR